MPWEFYDSTFTSYNLCAFILGVKLRQLWKREKDIGKFFSSPKQWQHVFVNEKSFRTRDKHIKNPKQLPLVGLKSISVSDSLLFCLRPLRIWDRSTMKTFNSPEIFHPTTKAQCQSILWKNFQLRLGNDGNAYRYWSRFPFFPRFTNNNSRKFSKSLGLGRLKQHWKFLEIIHRAWKPRLACRSFLKKKGRKRRKNVNVRQQLRLIKE